MKLILEAPLRFSRWRIEQYRSPYRERFCRECEICHRRWQRILGTSLGRHLASSSIRWSFFHAANRRQQGLGGRVGSGTQGMSWIHEFDMNGLFEVR